MCEGCVPMMGYEPWSGCPTCRPRGAEHDRTAYGTGPAFTAAAVMLLWEAGATADQVDLILGAIL